MATYYAWSRFKKGVNEWGRVEGFIEPGEKISKDDIKVSDAEWQSLIDSGAVRTEPYPDISRDMSPAEYYRANPDASPDNDNSDGSEQLEIPFEPETKKGLFTQTPQNPQSNKENPQTGS